MLLPCYYHCKLRLGCRHMYVMLSKCTMGVIQAYEGALYVSTSTFMDVVRCLLTKLRHKHPFVVLSDRTVYLHYSASLRKFVLDDSLHLI